jgi:hypothetical protein
MFNVAPTNVAAPLVPVVVKVKVFCLLAKAVFKEDVTITSSPLAIK